MADVTIELEKERCVGGHYIIQGTLGVGGFGITYVAIDTNNRKKCAIKELFPNGLVTRMADGVTVTALSESKKGYFEHSKDRFLEEAEILQSLKSVKEVVTVYDFFMENGTCYFVMEYLDAISLKKMITLSKGTMPYKIAENITYKLGNALIVVHSHNFFHRDISPDNIMVKHNGDIKLIDFGNAKNLLQKENQKYSVVLKPGFSPLEQYSSVVEQGTYTDVYAFACTVYYMLTGKMMPDALQRQAGIDYKHLVELGYPQYVSDAIDNALKLKVANRTQTVQKFLYDLRLFNDNKKNSDEGNQWLTMRYQEVVNDKNSFVRHIKETKAYVEVMQVGRQKKIYRIPSNKSIIIGRDKNVCYITVENDEYISKKHCQLIYDERSKMFFVMDLSTNGLYIKGNKLPFGKPQRIEQNVVVMLGSNLSGFKAGVKYDQ